MDVKIENICRICLNEVYKEFEDLDDTAKRMFDVLLLKMNWGISKEPVMCQECAGMTKKCFTFKTACVNTENVIRSHPERFNLKDILAVIRGDSNICRFCMDQFETSRLFPVNALSKELEMFPTYLPEMDFNMTKDPLICTPCRENLECYVKFAQRCTDIEEKICKYCTDDGNDVGQIKLSDIQPFFLKDPDNSSLLPVIKEEPDTFDELLMKSEEPIDIKDGLFNFVEISSKTESKSEVFSHETEVRETTCTCDGKHSSDTCNCRPFIPVKDPLAIAKTYKCSVCTYETKYNSNLTTHLLVHKSPSEVQMHKCSVCTFETKFRRSFSRHLLIHKGETKIYKCQTCTYETDHKSHLNCHLLTHKIASGTKLYKCTICTYETSHKSALTSHLLVHTEVKMYKCSVCAYETRFKRSLIRHLPKHKAASEMHKCSFCDFETKHKKSLSCHLRTHKSASETKSYKCSICTYETNYKSALISHLLVHKDASETQMYKCAVCGYETKRKGNLASHVLVHKDASETKMYKCSICTYETKYKSSLNTHLLFHKDPLEIKMYKCSVCTFEATSKGSLTSHLLSHKGASEAKKHKCSLCISLT